ncbi:pitrilysin family protein [Hydrogenophaga sp. 5NK40-0174]|uniref:M16 family metallopeptidase n=1 Tax=Hydrogenophaga sp. 5NK40-0174 TaxID=3127649 RepID=UPI003107DEAF
MFSFASLQTAFPRWRRLSGSGRQFGWLLASAMSLAASTAQAAIPIEHWTHGSGAKVYFVNSPTIPMLDVQVDFDGGTRRDPADKAGLADVTAGMLSSGVKAWKGRAALDENGLSEAWVDLGAQFEASASVERFTFSLRTLTDPDLLSRSVSLAAHEMAAPSFDARIWARDRDRMRASLREAETQPGTHAQRAFFSIVYRDHPYSRYATEASLDAITPADMEGFYARHVVPCRAKVTLVGAIDRAKADTIVGELMGAIGGQACAPLSAVAEVQALEKAEAVRMPFQAAQAQIFVGQPGIKRDDPDFLPLYVGNYILGGGGFVSRLMKAVREERGLSYSVYSYFPAGLHAGAFRVGLTTRPDQAKEALKVSQDVVAEFVDKGPTAQELEAAKSFLVNGFALRIDSNRKLLGNVANIAWYDLPLNHLDTWVESIQAVSLQQIHDAFQRKLQPGKMATVVVGGVAD